jgi:GT2 family glycosyltransferase
MMKIATLITCYNRKEKTVDCLYKIFEVIQKSNTRIENSIFLTDDDSTDGTRELVKELFPTVTIILGNGTLYWAGGMRKAWAEALKYDFEGFLLINDDTVVFENLFDDIVLANKYSYKKYGKGGVYVGSTKDKNGNLSYGGSIYLNKFLNRTSLLIPNDEYQECHLGTANVTYVSKDVVNKIGILHKNYVHGVADYDYTYSAYNKKMPLFILKGYQGLCENDHNHEGYVKFISLGLKDRIRFLYSPRGFQFDAALLFQRRFFPYRYPFVFCAAWLKVLFPKFYFNLNRERIKIENLH